MDRSDLKIILLLLAIFLIGDFSSYFVGVRRGENEYIESCEKVVLEKAIAARNDGFQEGYKAGVRDILREQDEDGKR